MGIKRKYHGKKPSNLNQAKIFFIPSILSIIIITTEFLLHIVDWSTCFCLFQTLRMQSVCQRVGTCSSCLKRQLSGFLGLIKWQRRLVPACVRTTYSETGKWEKSYGLETRKRVENWWLPRIKDQFCKISETDVRYGNYMFDIFVFSEWNLLKIS